MYIIGLMESVVLLKSKVQLYWDTKVQGSFILLEGVNNLKPGDRVAIEPGIPCRHCIQCRSGRYNLCPDITFHATPPYDGTLTNYVEHAADFCYKMAPHMTFEEGALIEPLSVAVHSCGRALVRAGTHVLILGAGPIGLVVLLVARASGATKIIVSGKCKTHHFTLREVQQAFETAETGRDGAIKVVIKIA
jgi:threonine dehydrogenase-like Zn-dependent dehydrogenase